MFILKSTHEEILNLMWELIHERNAIITGLREEVAKKENLLRVSHKRLRGIRKILGIANV